MVFLSHAMVLKLMQRIHYWAVNILGYGGESIAGVNYITAELININGQSLVG
jgi:hypothetical protein